MVEELADAIGVDPDFDTSTQVLVVTGANAAGKSLLRKFMQQVVRQDHDLECIHLSQQGRASSGIQRAFLYGDESWESTGCISCHSLLGSITTSRAREKDHMIILDEPEIGMGEELQAGSGLWLKEQLADWPEHLSGMVIMTHSRNFVREIMKFNGATFYNLEGMEKDEWLNREIVPANPEDVKTLGRERFRKISKILKDIKSDKEEDQ
jgi:hypothetical protein